MNKGPRWDWLREEIPKVENLVLLLLKLKEVADIRPACHRRIFFGCDPDFYQRRHILLIYISSRSNICDKQICPFIGPVIPISRNPGNRVKRSLLNSHDTNCSWEWTTSSVKSWIIWSRTFHFENVCTLTTASGQVGVYATWVWRS